MDYSLLGPAAHSVCGREPQKSSVREDHVIHGVACFTYQIRLRIARVTGRLSVRFYRDPFVAQLTL